MLVAGKLERSPGVGGASEDGTGDLGERQVRVRVWPTLG